MNESHNTSLTFRHGVTLTAICVCATPSVPLHVDDVKDVIDADSVSQAVMRQRHQIQSMHAHDGEYM